MIALVAPLVAQAVALVFAPPLDVPLTYRISEVRDEGERVQRFATDRRVTFRRAPDGFTATIETLKVAGTAGRAGAVFEATVRAMIGRNVVVRLDRDGRVVDVDDLDAIWDAQVAAMAGALSSSDPARVTAAGSLVAPLRALPRAARVARIGDMVAALIAERLPTPGPSRAITLPTRGQDGAAAMLAGAERVVVEPDRTLILERRASGIVSGSPMSLSLRRRIDPRTGLVAETVNIQTFETAGAQLIVTRSTVILP